MRWLRRVFWGLAGATVVASVGSSLVVRLVLERMDLLPSEARTRKFFASAQSPMPEIKIAVVGSKLIRYAVQGGPDRPGVLFMHGSPGSWLAWKGYFVHEALAERRLIAVDRPGYGGSDRGQPVPSLGEQARLIAEVLRREASRPVVLVGHSLGGPVAARVAMDAPELVAGLVLVAASADPDLEEEKWFQVPLSWRWIRWALPAEVDVCNQEILSLRGELREMASRWSRLDRPTIVIQGLADQLVPPANADFLERRLPKPEPARRLGAKIIRVPGLNHFVPWERPDLVRNAILELHFPR